jgi:hypothetical protein
MPKCANNRLSAGTFAPPYSFTVVLQWYSCMLLWCYRGVTVELLCCYCGVTVLVPWCYRGLIVVLLLLHTVAASQCDCVLSSKNRRARISATLNHSANTSTWGEVIVRSNHFMSECIH